MTTFQVLSGAGASSLRVLFQPGACIKAESDALISKTSNVELTAGMDGGGGGLLGGIFQAGCRLLQGESFFMQYLKCGAGQGEALLAASEIGDIKVLDLVPMIDGQQPEAAQGAVRGAVLVANGAFLCADSQIEMKSRCQSLSKGLFDGSGFVLMHCSGTGKVAINCMGSCIRYDLGPGESRHVDNGHLVAWTETVKYSLGLASVSLMNSLGSGEGLMCSFMGPGTVWIRTHKPSIGSSGKNQNEQRRNSSPAGLALFCCIIVVFMLFFGGMVLLAVMSDSGPDDSSSSWQSQRPRSSRGNVGRYLEF